MEQNVEKLKEKVVQGLHVLAKEGIIENRGHVSARVPGKDLMVMPGHIHVAGKTLGNTTLDDVIIVDFDGNVIEGSHEPVDEFYIHAEVYRKRKDINAIVHAHPHIATAFSIARQPILPIILEGVIFAGGTPIYDAGGRIVTKEQGKAVADVLGDAWAALLRGHGIVTVGKSVEQACVLAVQLEKTAEMQLRVAQIGEVSLLTPEDFGWDFVLSDDYYLPTWAYLCSK